MKKCPKCSKSEQETQFYSTGCYCIDCCKKQQREWYLKNKVRKATINRNWRSRHKDRRKAQVDAGNRLWKAIRTGEVIRGTTCQWCGSTNGIEGAHIDYQNPLDVFWLCRVCHRGWDKSHPKSQKYENLPSAILS